MSEHPYHPPRLGILGGGQLGRMLIQSAINFGIPVSVMDPDEDAPCSHLGFFTVGSLNDYDAVMAFGTDCDVITIEIENVNTRALVDLVKQGKRVFPQPELIGIIQDKGLQKQFYRESGIPTAEFVLVENKKDVAAHTSLLPAVNKLRREGYDGRGVKVLNSADALDAAFDAPGVLERRVEIKTEISVLAARNEQDDVVTYPPVEMVFNTEQNLVAYLFSPAAISEKLSQRASELAVKTIKRLGLVGLLAVEMFVTRDNEILVNEVAPRPHNSGHHTIEANATSQFEQHLRAIMRYPLGSTGSLSPSAMVNILGQPGFSGPARCVGWDKLMAMEKTYIHMYGKKLTKPYRKMGHVTILGSKMEDLRRQAVFVMEHFKVIA